MNKNRVTPTEVGVVGVCTDFSCNNCKKKSNNRLLKIFAAGGLAFFMGVGTLCGVLIAPMNAAHATTSGATSASNAANPAGGAQTPDRALSPQEQLLAGTLELDPENDPVIYTTDYGLDIRWHMAGLPANSADMLPPLESGKFPGYAYIHHADVNWVIIGHSNKSTTIDNGVFNLANILSYYQKAGYYNFSNTTSGIWKYLSNSIDDELENLLNEI
ncbi:MAG: hypothetical protein ACLRFR_03245, partial [Clostridia bacterium]